MAVSGKIKVTLVWPFSAAMIANWANDSGFGFNVRTTYSRSSSSIENIEVTPAEFGARVAA